MPRKLRVHLPDLPLHLIVRGVERRNIFLDDRDREYYLRCMKEAFELHQVRLLAECLMTNHVHALAAPSEKRIGLAMHLLQTKYAHYFNNRYDRSGHLFQDRFISVPVRSIRHLVTVADYITDNPVRAGIVPRRERWRWSSHGELMGRSSGGRLDLDCLPDVAGMSREEFLEAYRYRVETQADRLRSMTLAEMADEAAALAGLTPDELAEGGRSAALAHARRLVLRWGRPRGFTVVEMAEVLGCTPEALYMLGPR
jgi:REP element-mobilizing transposase RayT